MRKRPFLITLGTGKCLASSSSSSWASCCCCCWQHQKSESHIRGCCCRESDESEVQVVDWLLTDIKGGGAVAVVIVDNMLSSFSSLILIPANCANSRAVKSSHFTSGGLLQTTFSVAAAIAIREQCAVDVGPWLRKRRAKTARPLRHRLPVSTVVCAGTCCSAAKGISLKCVWER